MNPQPAWLPRLEALLGHPGDPGAQLIVTDNDHHVVYRAPLARHYRLDAPEPNSCCLWIRPIQGGHVVDERQPGEPSYAFSLSASRRRGLEITATRESHHPHRLEFELAAGQHATIAPAGADLQAELERWDTWTTVVLPADVEADLEALTEDSWHGPYA